MYPQCITKYPGQCSPYPLLVLHIKVSLKVLFLSKTGTAKLFRVMLAGGAVFNLSNVDSSSKGKDHLTVGPVSVCSIIQDEQAHFFL